MGGPLERRGAPLSLDGGGTLTGVALRYGDIAHVGHGVREMFRPGAFGEFDTPDLTLQHDPGFIVAPAAIVDLTDAPDALRLRTRVDPRGAAADLVRRGALRGLSVEFRALDERVERDVRVIVRAALRGLSLVDRPAYSASGVAVGAAVPPRGRFWLGVGA